MRTKNNNILYQDSLVTITNSEIIFRKYGLFGADKRIAITEFEKITYSKPTLKNGKYRYHGTGDFKTWFPTDYARSRRDLIFFANIKNKWQRIGFTVENTQEFITVLKDIDLVEEKDIDISFDFSQDLTKIEKRNKWLIRSLFIVVGILIPIVVLALLIFSY